MFFCNCVFENQLSTIKQLKAKDRILFEVHHDNKQFLWLLVTRIYLVPKFYDNFWLLVNLATIGRQKGHFLCYRDQSNIYFSIKIQVKSENAMYNCTTHCLKCTKQSQSDGAKLVHLSKLGCSNLRSDSIGITYYILFLYTVFP